MNLRGRDSVKTYRKCKNWSNMSLFIVLWAYYLFYFSLFYYFIIIIIVVVVVVVVVIIIIIIIMYTLAEDPFLYSNSGSEHWDFFFELLGVCRL